MSTGTVIARKARLRPPSLSVTNLEEIKEAGATSRLYQISPSLFISGYEGAKNNELLKSHQITHILNLAGESKCPNKHHSSFYYYSLKMPDNPKLDILFFLYFAVVFIREVIENKGKVLVHCIKGTSRAAAVVLAYLILQGLTEAEAYFQITSSHPNIDPNFGFVCQLKELGRTKEEKRVYKYSLKYDMFIGCLEASGYRIEINGDRCLLIGQPETEGEELKALLCLETWEKINKAKAEIVYCDEF